MDEGRRSELEGLLRGRLAEQREDGRAAWLAEQLENYVERWIGFAEAMPAPLASQLEGDLFGMVEIGTRVMDEEVRRAPRRSALEDVWDDFTRVLSGIRTGARSRPAELREALSHFRTTLH